MRIVQKTKVDGEFWVTLKFIYKRQQGADQFVYKEFGEVSIWNTLRKVVCLWR